MIAVILAGGFGTRLRSVVSDLPKPLAPVNGKYFVEYLVEHLRDNGVRDIIFCVHYMAEKIMEHFGNGERFGVRITYSVEKEPMGTGGAIGLCRHLIRETFCVLNADTYLELDIRDCASRHHTGQALVSMAAAYMEDTSRYGQIQLKEDGRILGFLEKKEAAGQVGYINAGFYMMEPRIFDYIPAEQPVSLETDVFPALLHRKETIIGYPDIRHFLDIGIPEDYMRFQQWINEMTNQ